MKIALITCSSKKVSVPCPAYLMYSSSPRFCLHYCHALNQNYSILIISGKYGLISPKQIIYPYNQSISSQTEQFKKKIKTKIINLKNENNEIYSYLSSIYKAAAMPKEVEHIQVLLKESMFKQSSKLKTGKRLIDEERVIFWVIEKCHKKGSIFIEDLKEEFVKRGYSPKTLDAQILRLKNDPFIYVKNNKIYYRLKNNIWNFSPYDRGFNLY